MFVLNSSETIVIDEPEMETIRCQLASVCEAFCFQQNKSSSVEEITLNVRELLWL